MDKQYKYEMKPLFKERMKKLLKNEEDFKNFEETVHTSPKNYIRCNTLKISTDKLFQQLSKKWNVKQPFPANPEIMLIDEKLLPGEIGNSIEHLLGFYYIQEIVSMLPPIALDPQPGELILDLFASPGSKTTQIASYMKNRGTIIANDLKMDRISILSANLEKAGVTNTIVTKKDAISLCFGLKRNNFKFDRILADVPCSGEGTLRSSPKTFLMWNEKVVKKLSRLQKVFVENALKLLKKQGTLIYSTCTHAPEENEEIIDFMLKNFPVEIESINLPIKCRSGITEWEEKKFSTEVKKSCRVYPHDNDSEGFFLAKIKLLEEIK